MGPLFRKHGCEMWLMVPGWGGAVAIWVRDYRTPSVR